MRALDRASALLSATTMDAGQPVIGTANLVDPAEMIRGWCLYDLGQPAEAATVLGWEVARIPASGRRAHTRFAARQALVIALISSTVP